MRKHFVWSEIFSVGVKEMDDQHKQFFKIADDILNLIGSGDFKNEGLLEHATKLGDYALYHLGSEEEYFKKFKCENMDQHLDAHNAFRRQVVNFISLLRDKKTGITQAIEIVEDMASFSTNWLADHILVMDKGYTTCFHEHELY